MKTSKTLKSVLFSLVFLVGGGAYADPLWTIGTFDNSQLEFDPVPHDDADVVNYSIGDPVSTFPNGFGTDIGLQRSTVNVNFSGTMSQVSTLTVRWSPGGSVASEQFRILLDGMTIADSAMRVGGDPVAWTSDLFSLPPSPGTAHVLAFVHLAGDGTFTDAISLTLVPEPSSVGPVLVGMGAIVVGKFRRSKCF